MAVTAGNLWFVCAIGCNVNVANHTNHKFPTATPTGIPCEVKSTVATGAHGVRPISGQTFSAVWAC